MTLDELKNLEASATPGPWEESGEVPGAVAHLDSRLNRPMNVFGLDIDGYAICSQRNDAAFIAAARNMVPRLIAVAEAARLQQSYNEPHSAHAEISAALAALEGP